MTNWMDDEECTDLWHVAASIRHPKCPDCGHSWKRDDADLADAKRSIVFTILGSLLGAGTCS